MRKNFIKSIESRDKEHIDLRENPSTGRKIAIFCSYYFLIIKMIQRGNK